MEGIWRVLTHIRKYPEGVIRQAAHEYHLQRSNFEELIGIGDKEINSETIDSIFMGLYHHQPEITTKPQRILQSSNSLKRATSLFFSAN